MPIGTVREGTAYGGDGNVNPALAYPSSPAAGEILLAAFYSTATSGASIGTPAGWTQDLHDLGAHGLLAVFSKVADGTETGTLTFTLSGHTQDRSVVGKMFAIPGAGSTVTLGTVYTQAVDVAEDIGPITGVTTSVDNSLAWAVGARMDNWTSADPPTSWTDRGEKVHGGFNDDVGIQIASLLKTPAGATGSVTVPITGGAWTVAKGVQFYVTPVDATALPDLVMAPYRPT